MQIRTVVSFCLGWAWSSVAADVPASAPSSLPVPPAVLPASFPVSLPAPPSGSLPASLPAPPSGSLPASLPVPPSATPPPAPPKPPERRWFERYSIRGYGQLRFNRTLSQDAAGAEAQLVGDASVADDQTFFLRRARLIFSGDVSDRVSVYLQPDFAVAQGDNLFFTQLRDWYADLHLDDEKIFRVRVGQSKLPFGWENLQSSGNRLPLDRNDALNSGLKNERDLGAIFYWTPPHAQDFFRRVIREGMKGSGNYGVAGLGVYAGQGGSLREQNDRVHVVARLTWPFSLPNGQLMEVGAQAYSGAYVVPSSAISPRGVGEAARPAGTLENGGADGLLDQRAALSFMYYPQPFGLQAEWTVGRGPGLNEAQTAVEVRPLQGGYVMAMYRFETEGGHELWPFFRYNLYEGGYKTERNAPFVRVAELELGAEWQLGDNVELVAMYTASDRTNTRAISEDDTPSYKQFRGSLLRFQLQFSY